MLLLLLLYFSFSNVAHCSCPDGFDLVSEGQCRGLYDTIPAPNLHWNDLVNTAITKCGEIQSQPVIIHDDEEQAYWKHKLEQPGSLIIFGLLCNPTSKNWEWADGSALDYKPSDGFDSQLNSECTTGATWYMQYNSGYWSYTTFTGTSSSSFTFYFYCTTQIYPPVRPTGGCEKFAEDSDDEVCYQIGTTAESWQDAQLICKKLGANLASIHNANENAFVRRLAVSKGDVHGVFLGATVSGKGGNFGWIDGSAWDFTNFFPGFPKSGFGDCIALDTSAKEGQWMNVECSSQIPVACIRKEIAPLNATVNSTCSYDTLMEGAIFTSPGFPFDASMPCDYFLEADAGKKVEVEIALLEANSCCDSLILYEGYFGGFVIANLTGEIRNVTYTTESNIMRVSWQPNGGVNVRGMAMTFRGV